MAYPYQPEANTAWGAAALAASLEDAETLELPQSTGALHLAVATWQWTTGFPTAAPAAPAGLPAGLVNLSLQCALQ